jgi:tRNA threonylcarbamoyladenosine biosynthesis protein TsaB
MKILALDTTANPCSVALVLDGQVDEIVSTTSQRQGDAVLNLVETLLKRHRIQLAELDLLACSHGPGSFTGIRIGMNVVQAFALATAVPVVCVSSLKALAYAASQQKPGVSIITAIDARMSELYFAAYDDAIETIYADCLLTPTALPQLPPRSWYGVGSAWALYEKELMAHYTGQLIEVDARLSATAGDIAALACTEHVAGNSKAAEDIFPHYIRNKVTN